MQPVTRYQTADGTLYNTPKDADAHEQLIAAIEAVLQPLGPRPDGEQYSYGKDHIQHDLQVVAAVRIHLIALSRPEIGYWMESEEQNGTDMMKIDPAYFCRALDHRSLLNMAWNRLCCIDTRGREWSGAYYTWNSPWQDDPN